MFNSKDDVEKELEKYYAHSEASEIYEDSEGDCNKNKIFRRLVCCVSSSLIVIGIILIYFVDDATTSSKGRVGEYERSSIGIAMMPNKEYSIAYGFTQNGDLESGKTIKVITKSASSSKEILESFDPWSDVVNEKEQIEVSRCLKCKNLMFDGTCVNPDCSNH